MAKERKIKEIRTGGGMGGKIIAFLLGILMGIIVIVGALGGAVYYVWTRPVKDTIELIDGEENGNIYQLLFGDGVDVGYLNEEYASKRVGDLLADTISTINDLAAGDSLEALETISPKVRPAVQSLVEAAATYGVPLSEHDLMTTPVNELGTYTTDQLYETSIGGLLKGVNGEETVDPIMLAICYGEEGVDYTYDSDGNVVMAEGKQATTINQLISGTGVTDQVNKMTLEAIDIDPNDPIMRTLAYGPASHYETVTNAKGDITSVVMKQMTFTYEEGKLYDIDGELVDGTFDSSTNVLTLDGVTYYLDTQAKARSGGASSTTYYAYTDEERTKAALYPKTKVKELTSNASSLVDSLYLSDALNVNNSSHKVLISLAYGAEGEDYTVNTDGTIALKEGVTPRTIGDLKGDNKEIIDGIYLKDALDITPSSHKVLIALAYGKKGIDYEIEKVNGVDTFKMLDGKTPKTIKDISGDNSEALINDIYIADALDITTSSHRVLISIAYGHEGENYDIVGDEIIPREGEDNQPRTLGDLSGDKSTDVINGVYLADALNVTPTSDNVLITLAYGKEGEDYVIEDNKFKCINGAKPRTLEDLSGDISTILDDIALADVIDPDPKSAIIMYLLYGREDIHFTFVDNAGTKEAKPLQQRIAILKIAEGEYKVYNPYGEEIAGEIDEANGTFTVTKTGGAGETPIVTVYKYSSIPFETMANTAPLVLKDGTNETEIPYSYLYKEDGTTPVYYEATTIGDLSGENNTITMLTKRLTIRELLGDSKTKDHIFLKHVQDETIETLPDAINDLTFTDVYAKDIYETIGITDPNYSQDADKLKGSYFIDENGAPIKDANNNIVYTSDDISAVKDQLVVTSTWWYLLHNDEECHAAHCENGVNCPNSASECPSARTCLIHSCGLDNETCHLGNGSAHLGHCHLGDECGFNTAVGTCSSTPDCARKGCIYDYKITDFEALVDNMTDNMKNATLLCLEHDGIVDLTPQKLHTTIKSSISISRYNVEIPIETPKRTEVKTDANGEVIKDADGNPVYKDKVYLYEMTINEILSYSSSVLNAITTLENTLNGQT